MVRRIVNSSYSETECLGGTNSGILISIELRSSIKLDLLTREMSLDHATHSFQMVSELNQTEPVATRNYSFNRFVPLRSFR